MLFVKPDLFLLGEPIKYLDIESREKASEKDTRYTAIHRAPASAKYQSFAVNSEKLLKAIRHFTM